MVYKKALINLPSINIFIMSSTRCINELVTVLVIVESLSSIPQNTAEAMWSVKLTDSLAGHCNLGSFHAMPTLETTLSGFQIFPSMQINK